MTPFITKSLFVENNENDCDQFAYTHTHTYIHQLFSALSQG